MASVKVILRPTPGREEHAIYLRVIIDRKKKLYSLKQFILAEHWNEQAQKVKGKQGNSMFLNGLIGDKVREVEKLFLKFEEEGRVLTLDSFHASYKLKQNGSRSFDFYAFFEHEFKIQQGRIRNGTLRVYRQMRNKLKAFKPSLNLHDIDYDFLLKFQNYLRNDRGLNSNTASKQLSILRTYMTLAVKKGIIQKNPFDLFPIKRGTGNRQFLQEEEVRKIADLKLTNAGEMRARDMFLFSCSTGVAFADLISLKWTDVQGKMLCYIRLKTSQEYNEDTGAKKGKPITIPLTQMAKEILERQPKEDTETVFQKITNQKYNEHLHTLERKALLTKPLTSHVARHTCATLFLTNGVPIDVVSSILGHSNLKTTQIYAKIIDQRKIEEMKKVMGLYK